MTACGPFDTLACASGEYSVVESVESPFCVDLDDEVTDLNWRDASIVAEYAPDGPIMQ